MRPNRPSYSIGSESKVLEESKVADLPLKPVAEPVAKHSSNPITKQLPHLIFQISSWRNFSNDDMKTGLKERLEFSGRGNSGRFEIIGFATKSPRNLIDWNSFCIFSDVLKRWVWTLVEKLLDFFSKNGGDTSIIRKTHTGKHRILSRFPIMEKIDFSISRSKHPACACAKQPNLHLLHMTNSKWNSSACLTCWEVKVLPYISSFPPKFIREKSWKTPTPNSRLQSAARWQVGLPRYHYLKKKGRLLNILQTRVVFAKFCTNKWNL